MSNTHGPIQKEQEENMKVIGRGLDDILNGENCPRDKKKWGFAFLVFPFGEAPEGRINYLSNAEREDMLVSMKEFIARAEGNYVEPSNNNQKN